jgi:hypothetical protein
MTVLRIISLGAMGMSALWCGMRSPSMPAPSGSITVASDEIAFASRRDGDWEIYAMVAAGQ